MIGVDYSSSQAGRQPQGWYMGWNEYLQCVLDLCMVTVYIYIIYYIVFLSLGYKSKSTLKSIKVSIYISWHIRMFKLKFHLRSAPSLKMFNSKYIKLRKRFCAYNFLMSRYIIFRENSVHKRCPNIESYIYAIVLAHKKYPDRNISCWTLLFFGPCAYSWRTTSMIFYVGSCVS